MRLDSRTMRLSAGLAMIVGVGVSALVYPSLRAASAASDRRTAVRTTLAQTPDHTAMMNREVATRDALLSYTQTAIKPIPEGPDSASLIRDVTIFLDKRDIRDRELAISTPLVVGPLVVTPLTVGFRASFADAHALLRHLENAPRLLRIRSIRIGRVSMNASDASTLNLDGPLRVEILLELLHAPPSAVGKPAP